MGGASETTTARSSAASICEMSVEPHRDMWKMKPVGESASMESAASNGISRRKQGGERIAPRRAHAFIEEGLAEAAGTRPDPLRQSLTFGENAL